MPALHALDQGSVALFGQGIDEVDAGLVRCQNIQRSYDTDVGSNNGLCGNAFTVAGNRHVAHHIDVGNVFAKEADGGFGGFRDPLHQFLCLNVPHIGLAGRGMDHGLADPAVRASDTDVLVGAAEAALYMSLEMGQGQHGIIVQHALADRHLFEPLAAFHRKHGRAFRVGNVHGREGPSVHLQRLFVLLGGIAVTLIIGVGLNDRGVRKPLLEQFPDKGTGNDVGAVLFACVELDRDPAFQNLTYFVEDPDQAFRGKVPGEIHDRTVSGSLVKRNILVSACSGFDNFICHMVPPCKKSAESFLQPDNCLCCYYKRFLSKTLFLCNPREGLLT